MDNGFITGAVFLDLRKAFATVNHQIETTMEWFKSSLSDHEQVTSIGNCLSSSRSVTVGVPQGSILGPLLFIIYVNDYYSAKSTQDVQTFLNKDLESASLWLQSNLLTLNCSKSRFLLFESKRRLKSLGTVAICINDSLLKEAISFKYLGDYTE